LGKTRNSVCPRTANCSDVFFLPFPLHIHADTVDDTSFQICFTSPNLNCLFVCFARVDFSDSPSVRSFPLIKLWARAVSNVNRAIWKISIKTRNRN
jgi:hypothetical protein